MSANGAARPDITARVTAVALRQLAEAEDMQALTEMPLPDGRRADLVALAGDGTITILEVKSCLSDWLADDKWPDYVAWCDRFAFCVPLDFPVDALPEEVGILVADDWEADWLRPPQPQKLAPARRRSLTLRFARLAARRLQEHRTAIGQPPEASHV